MAESTAKKIQLCYNCKRQVDPDVSDPAVAESWIRGEELHEHEPSMRKIIAGELEEIDYCPICSDLLNSDLEFDVVDYEDDEYN